MLTGLSDLYQIFSVSSVQGTAVTGQDRMIFVSVKVILKSRFFIYFHFFHFDEQKKAASTNLPKDAFNQNSNQTL